MNAHPCQKQATIGTKIVAGDIVRGQAMSWLFLWAPLGVCPHSMVVLSTAYTTLEATEDAVPYS